MDIDENKLAYIAGFVDGEGCLAISKRKHKNKIGEWIGYSCHVDLTNTNKEVMDFLQTTIGTSSKVYENRLKGNRKLAYRLRLNKLESEKLLLLIERFLIVKREQARVFLDFCKNSKDKENRELLWLKMKSLNHRGL